MERYTEVLRIDPENADALYYVAVVACQENQFQQGIALGPPRHRVGAPQARVHNLIGKAQERLGQPAGGDQDRSTRPSRSTRNSPRRMATAPASWLRAGWPTEALKSFDRALALNPTIGARSDQPRRAAQDSSAARTRR